jgi:hypothetical protein
MLELGVPVGAGTDATRVANYNPWNSLYWLVSGRTLGGLELYPEKNRLSREEALRLYTVGSAWFSHDTERKGRLAIGQLADLAVLSDDYFSVEEERIKSIESLLTVLDGKIVYAAGGFSSYAPPTLPITPDWAPIAKFGGYGAPGYYAEHAAATLGRSPRHSSSCGIVHHSPREPDTRGLWGSGCDCFAF